MHQTRPYVWLKWACQQSVWRNLDYLVTRHCKQEDSFGHMPSGGACRCYQSCGSGQQKSSTPPSLLTAYCHIPNPHRRLPAAHYSTVSAEVITLTWATSIGCAKKKALRHSRQGGDVICQRQQREAGQQIEIRNVPHRCRFSHLSPLPSL
jgi:hypothetical protein